MRFGTFHLIGSPEMVPAERRFAETMEQIVLADELGLDYVWVAEHHFSNYGYSANPLLVIAKASAVAKRVRFGQSVIVAPFWDPLRLAEDIAVTDILTDGRLDVGLGRGYQHMEFEGFGIPIEESRSRFVEQIDLMQAAWTRDDLTFQGQHYQVEKPLTVLPRPIQVPHPPLWIAAQSRPSLDWAAEQGHRVLMTGGSSTTPQELVEWRDGYIKTWKAKGRSEADVRIGLLRFIYVAESEAEAREAVWQTRWQRRVAAHLRLGDEQIMGGRNKATPFAEELDEEAWWDRLVYGTPDQCIAKLRRDADLGMTDLLGWFDVGGLEGPKVARSMQLFAREVLPALAEVGVR